jgi:hypothetical protein
VRETQRERHSERDTVGETQRERHSERDTVGETQWEIHSERDNSERDTVRETQFVEARLQGEQHARARAQREPRHALTLTLTLRARTETAESPKGSPDTACSDTKSRDAGLRLLRRVSRVSSTSVPVRSGNRDMHSCARAPYEGKVANREIGVWHGATETGP